MLSGLDYEGYVESLGRVGYVPQQAFVLSGTIRENIVVGEEADEVWYQRVLSLSCLQLDLANMRDGDQTEVSSKCSQCSQ
jgi:ABC-type multidrug transport system fused ATPase/permease subunit